MPINHKWTRKVPGNSQANFKDKQEKKKMLILLPLWVEKDKTVIFKLCFHLKYSKKYSRLRSCQRLYLLPWNMFDLENSEMSSLKKNPSFKFYHSMFHRYLLSTSYVPKTSMCWGLIAHKRNKQNPCLQETHIHSVKNSNISPLMRIIKCFLYCNILQIK